jgi:hypothetical protein
VEVADGTGVWLGNGVSVGVEGKDGCGVGLAVGEGWAELADREIAVGIGGFRKADWQAVSKTATKIADRRSIMWAILLLFLLIRGSASKQSLG